MSARILVVDDALFMRRRLREILEGAGHRVVGEAEDGREALEAYDAERPDLVTLDLEMPNLGGLAALEELRAGDPDARVIVCSSLTDQGAILRAVALGARDYVAKPVDEDRLLEAVEKALRA